MGKARTQTGLAFRRPSNRASGFATFCMRILAFAMIVAILSSAFDLPTSAEPTSAFVGREGTHFVLDGKPYFVAGINNHYLTYGSSREVLRVLDDAVAMGANVVRTFVQPVIGSLDGVTKPTIWKWRSNTDSSDLGVHGTYMLYWDQQRGSMAVNVEADGLQKLDFLVSEAGKRNLRLIIAFLDFWKYTGGAQQMTAWYGGQDESSFFSDERTKNDYKQWVRSIMERANPLTGRAYKDEAIIFAWELINEGDIVKREPCLGVGRGDVGLCENH
jgi:mannan endo-1,4-beta-mannosidase